MKVRRRRELQLLCYSTFEDKNDTVFSFKIGIVHFLSMSDYSEEAKHIFEAQLGQLKLSHVYNHIIWHIFKALYGL